MKRYALILMLLAAPLLAQRGGVSYIQYLENGVTILPADGSSAVEAGLNIPLYPGDRLETERMARMEVALAEGSLVWIDQRSRIELRALALTDGFSDQRSYLYLGEGQAALEVLADPERGAEPVLGFAGGDFYAFSAGLYSLELRGRSVTIRLFSGRGELVTDRGSVLLQAGEEAIANEDGFVDRRRLRRDNEAFASFVEERRDLRLRSQSAQYTGDALSAYSYELDRNGSWVYMSDIGGYAWRPVVEVGWQPYYNGRWNWYHNDWFWVGYEPWSYVTHHYGRWSMFPGYGWAWVPGYAWAPSWVYWYYDPFYIGWSPLGYWDYWWWSGCHNCWGWDHHHGHHDGDHGGRGGGRHMNGHVNLAKLDHGAFVFSEADQFGKGKGTLTRGAEFKGRLDSKGAIKAIELPISRTDLANPGPVLKKAVLDSKQDLTPLFKKGFTATPQVKQILSNVQAKVAADSPAGRDLDRTPSAQAGEPRKVALPQGQSPQRQPMSGRSVTPSAPGSRTITGTPSSEVPSRGRSVTPEPSRSPISPSGGGSVTPSPSRAPNPREREAVPGTSASPTPRPSSGSSVSPRPSTSPTPRPSSGTSTAPTPPSSGRSTPAPSPAPSEPKKAEPSKSSYRAANLQDSGGQGTRASAAYDRQPVSVPSTATSYQPSRGSAYRSSSSSSVDHATPSRPSSSYSSSTGRSAPSNSGRSYSAPSTSSSAPSGSSRSYSAPSAPSRSHSAPSTSRSAPSGSSRGYSAPSTPSRSYSAPSTSPSAPSGSSRSYSAPSTPSRSHSAPSSSYSAPSGSSRGHSAPSTSSRSYSAPSSGGKVSSSSSSSSSGKSSSSKSSSSASSSSSSSPKK